MRNLILQGYLGNLFLEISLEIWEMMILLEIQNVHYKLKVREIPITVKSLEQLKSSFQQYLRHDTAFCLFVLTKACFFKKI